MAFKQWLNLESRTLAENRDLLKDNACWYEEMLSLAKARSDDESVYRDLLEQAWRRFPTNPNFFVGPIDYYSPRWGGSAQAKFAASPHPERWAKAFGRPTAFAEARGWAGASDRSKTGIAGLH
jgi:hypothetical protein